MVKTLEQGLAKVDSNCQPQPAGYDGGNGYSKLALGDSEILIPSYFTPIQQSQLYDLPGGRGSLVEYLGGTRTDLVSQQFLTGEPAYLRFPESCLKVSDDRRGKIKFGLQMLLGALGSKRWQPDYELNLVLSIQDAKALGSDLKNALAGEHTVRFNRHQYPTTVKIKVLRVVEEGAGAIAELIRSGQALPSQKVILLDIGHGTVITSVFAPRGKLLERKVTTSGVYQLIEAIAKNLETRKQLAKEGDRELISEAIENGNFIYGSTGWNFSQVYHQELKPWVSSSLATAIKSVEAWRDASNIACFAIGGGSALPLISPLLAQRGFALLPSANWLNARGLASLARLLGGA
ncbi:MAG: ParM/StbA family protein [Oscillatoria sp. PMC 1051.18]|nr:ParM/StbA family protein [Oscillatoria sp. PMC 1050.18]MEC5033263.1 ParM/StbA family protein [Oscillatoria sp. PMC 1051.18]